MPQQEMGYERPVSFYGDIGDVGFGHPSPYSMPGQKLSGQADDRQVPTAAQRLALALVSLGMLMGMTFGLVMTAIAKHFPGWVVFPVLCVLTLFSAAVVTINVVFNRNV